MVTAKSISWITRGHSVVVGSQVEPRLSVLSQFIYLVRGSIREATMILERFLKVFSVPSWTSCFYFLKRVPSVHASLSRKGSSFVRRHHFPSVIEARKDLFPSSPRLHPVKWEDTPLPSPTPNIARDDKGSSVIDICSDDGIMPRILSQSPCLWRHWHTSHSSQLFHRVSLRSPS